jgi:hypothetical protein
VDHRRVRSVLAAAKDGKPGAGSIRRRAGRRSAGRITPVRAVLVAGPGRPREHLPEGGRPSPVFAKQAGQGLEDRESEPQDLRVVLAGLDQPAEERQSQDDRGEPCEGGEGGEAQNARDVGANGSS